MTDKDSLATDRADLADTRADLAVDQARQAAGRADRSDSRADRSERRADKTDVTIAELAETLDEVTKLMTETLCRLEKKLDDDIEAERKARAAAIAAAETAVVAAARNRRAQFLSLCLAGIIVVLFSVGSIIGFHRQAVRLCDGQNQNRALLSSLILSSSADAVAPAGASPELRQAYADSNRRATEFRAHAAPLLKAVDCSHLGWLS